MGRAKGKQMRQFGRNADELIGAPATNYNNSSRRSKNKRRRRAAIDAKERLQGERKFSAMSKREQRRQEKKLRGEGRAAPQPSY